MTGPALDPRAVEAAVEALTLIPGTNAVYRRSVVLTVLTAAAPFLRAEGAAAERQRIAAAMRGELDQWLSLGATRGDGPLGLGSAEWAVQRAYESCIRIAEADPGTTAPTEGADRD